MKLDIQKFYKAVNPSKTVPEENHSGDLYYIDLSPVRGRRLIDEFKQTNAQANLYDLSKIISLKSLSCGHITQTNDENLFRIAIDEDLIDNP